MVYNVQLTLLTLLKMLDFRDFNPIVIFHINVYVNLCDLFTYRYKFIILYTARP